MCDDDFHFDFEDDSPCIDEPLHILHDGEHMFLGTLVEDGEGGAYMIRPYSILEDDDDETKAILIEVPRFKVDPFMELIFVTNADEMRMKHRTSALTLGYINGIPFMCNSTRH